MPTRTSFLLLLAIFACFSFAADSGGRAKSAYRNYYLGNYYFSEGLSKKAEPYLRRAYSALPEQLSFGLGYALCLAENGHPAQAEAMLGELNHSLQPGKKRKDFAAQEVAFHHVSAIIRARNHNYTAANQAIRSAIGQQERLDKYAHRKLAGMYNLAGYLAILDQETPRKHAGLKAHSHVRKQAIQTAYPFLFQALALDTSRQDTRANLKMVADTLGLLSEVVPEKKSTPLRLQKKQEMVNRYPHLPRNMASLEEFAAYDEVLFLVDISGSMVMEQVACVGTDRFVVMREAAQLLVDYLPPGSKAGLATIGGDCGTEPKWWIPIDSLDRKKLKWEINHLNPDGTTPLLTTLVRATELFSDDPETKKSICFISDGENVCSVSGLDICDWASRLPAQNISLNVLTFLGRDLSNSGAFAEYACLTDRSGGQVRYIDPLSCTVDEFGFDLADQVTFSLPELERVTCFGEETAALWAIYPEKER